MRLATPVLASCLSIVGAAHAGVIDTSGLSLAATLNTTGSYDDAGLSYWNGAPVSATNHPSAADNALNATWQFYVDPTHTNDLYIVASNVFDTHFGYASGVAFTNTALTGLNFSLSTFAGDTLATSSAASAVPGETLVGPSGNSQALTETPNWSLQSTQAAYGTTNYFIGTLDTDYGFTHYNTVNGATRIFGGGVVEVQYSPAIDLLMAADFATLAGMSVFGQGSYYGAGIVTLPTSVPEPGAMALFSVGLLTVGFAHARRQLPK